MKIYPKHLKHQIKSDLEQNGRWVFHLDNYKTNLVDKSFIFNYELLLKTMPYEIPVPFVQALTKYYESLKTKIFWSFEGMDELKVLMHFSICLFTFWTFYDWKEAEKLSDEINEFWYLPLPLGSIANDLIEILDGISIFPNITKLHKYFEDIPFLQKFDWNLKSREIYFV